ncbi:DNA polymerase III subunit delta' [Ferrigenium sp. UT5]|uniref:DNA polymerase III subunit delta' n=1 Tax=Ferrigenium sp. UT5 TaxID=3242105 RepID=UPI00354F38F6
MNELYPWVIASWQTLQELRKRLPNALLIKGAQGIGKLDLALNFAQSLLCEQPTGSGMACGVCKSCRWFEQDSHPDFRLVQPKALSEDEEEGKANSKKPSREVSVTQIRELVDFSSISSQSGGYKIILIHPAESMNASAANSLLKTLEEPSANVLFLLVSHKPQQLLPTIISRCQTFTVQPPTKEMGVAWLARQGVASPEQALAQSGGAPLQSLSWPEAGTEARTVLLNSLPHPSRFDPLTLSESLQHSEPVQVVHCLQQWCHDLTSAKLAGVVRYFPERVSTILALADNVTIAGMLNYQKELLAARSAAYHPLNQKLFMESILISYRRFFAS